MNTNTKYHPKITRVAALVLCYGAVTCELAAQNNPPLTVPIHTTAPNANNQNATNIPNTQNTSNTLVNSPRKTKPKSNHDVVLNFVNADIEAVSRTMAVITGHNIVVDPRVKGTINLSFENPLPPKEAYEQFANALRLQGISVIQSAGIYKVVPESEAKLLSTDVQSGTASTVSKQQGSRVITQIFKLNYENANNLLPVLRPLISPNNIINVNTGNNSLIITDYADNLQRLAKIIAANDLPATTGVDVIPLQHAVAVDLAPIILKLLDVAGGPTGVANNAANAGGSGGSISVLADGRSNSLLIKAPNPSRLQQIKTLITRLDQEGPQSTRGNTHVVFLKNADATELATTLRAVIAAEITNSSEQNANNANLRSAGSTSATSNNNTSQSNSSTAPVQGAAPISTGGQIQADPSTNSLIITASAPQYKQLRNIIDMLDGRRTQVFVESLIVELNNDKAAEFGVQWQGSSGVVGDAILSLLGTNFSSAGNNILNLTAQGIPEQGTTPTVMPGNGLNIGILPRTHGQNVLGVLARFIEQTGDGNVLSTPNLLTLDNREAKIVIGQNVPFITGQYTNNNSSSGSVNPFQTIERKDVGLTLRVKPQISENGTVRMQIFQEVSSVLASSASSASGLITNKRAIETNVLVDDGSIVVLGGLIQDEYSSSAQKVPLLGDIPVLGALFRNENRTRKKTNLMVFLRPVIVRDAKTSDQVSLDRYDLMRSSQLQGQPSFNSILSVRQAPIIPASPQSDAAIKETQENLEKLKNTPAQSNTEPSDTSKANNSIATQIVNTNVNTNNASNIEQTKPSSNNGPSATPNTSSTNVNAPFHTKRPLIYETFNMLDSEQPKLPPQTPDGPMSSRER